MAKAADYADNYVLTHKSTFNKNRSFGSTKKSYPEVGKKSENVAPEKSSDKGQTSSQTMSMDRKPKSFVPVCHYCKKPGHVMSMPNAFVSSKSEIITEEFKPFVSEGFVSLESRSSQVPIKILRHWGNSVLTFRRCIAIGCKHFYW